MLGLKSSNIFTLFANTIILCALGGSASKCVVLTEDTELEMDEIPAVFSVNTTRFAAE
jgi:hypothetical protein